MEESGLQVVVMLAGRGWEMQLPAPSRTGPGSNSADSVADTVCRRVSSLNSSHVVLLPLLGGWIS